MVPMINRHQGMSSRRLGGLSLRGRGRVPHDDENLLIRVAITNTTNSEFRFDVKLRRWEVFRTSLIQ